MTRNLGDVKTFGPLTEYDSIHVHPWDIKNSKTAGLIL